MLGAFDPLHAIRSSAQRLHRIPALGAVFLVVTGAEALYADMGHFGRKPIRLAWFALVLPASCFNYFGQGALLLREPGGEHPFFLLAPAWALLSPGRPRDAGGDHCVAGADLRFVFADAPGDQLGLRRASTSSTRRPTNGPDLRAQVNWALMFATVARGDRLPIVERCGRRVRHCGHAHDGHHRAAALRRDDERGTGRSRSRCRSCWCFSRSMWRSSAPTP